MKTRNQRKTLRNEGIYLNESCWKNENMQNKDMNKRCRWMDELGVGELVTTTPSSQSQGLIYTGVHIAVTKQPDE